MILGDENSPIAVLGVGNVLLSDEGFGVKLLQESASTPIVYLSAASSII